jgi:hypothetical protein
VPVSQVGLRKATEKVKLYVKIREIEEECETSGL